VGGRRPTAKLAGRDDDRWAGAGPDQPSSLEEVVERIGREGLRFAFVGERHGVGPVKRFAVDLANALVGRGHEVGLYVEGFRTDCAPLDPACGSLAQLFNRGAYLALADRSRATVHPIDPPEGDNRAARMAAVIAGGSEAIRVVLVGMSHVVFAGQPAAQYRVFGGGMAYPDPGDLAEAFPRTEYLTIGLETAADGLTVPYSLRRGGSGTDYVLSTRCTGDY
jgi:hypothetical protein